MLIDIGVDARHFFEAEVHVFDVERAEVKFVRAQPIAEFPVSGALSLFEFRGDLFQPGCSGAVFDDPVAFASNTLGSSLTGNSLFL